MLGSNICLIIYDKGKLDRLIILIPALPRYSEILKLAAELSSNDESDELSLISHVCSVINRLSR
jgi:hypothetical protein